MTKRKPKARRVLFQPRRGINHRGAVNAWSDDWARGRNSSVRTHPVCRLTEHGIDYGAEPQPGDEIGYCMDPYRTDDCLQAAIATATQTPIEQVPDPDLDRRLDQDGDPDEISRAAWERIGRWAAKRGLTAVLHEQVPVPRHRWIGVVPSSGTGDTAWAGDHLLTSATFGDHCLVMCHDRLIFDLSCSVKAPPGMKVVCFHPSQISYGISFDKEEQ